MNEDVTRVRDGGAACRAGEAETHDTVVALDGVSFSWPGADGFSLGVDRFSVGRGERVLLLGPSGGGKSTLLSLICGVNTASAGRVCVLGRDLTGLSAGARDRFRAEHIGVVFQMFNLLPYGSVIDNVILPLSFAPVRRTRAGGGHEAIVMEAGRLLLALGLDGSLFDGQTSRLSVGQQQRVAVARALIGSPEVIVADEPTSALDRDRQTLFLDLLLAQTRDAGSALVMVSHDETLAPMFDRVCALGDVLKVGGAK